MKGKQWPLFFITLLTIFSYLYWQEQRREKVLESITYFPADPKSTFLDAVTALDYEGREKKRYEINLRTFSNFDKVAYLRQDISFLFANGRLIGKAGKWKENVRQLENEHSFPYENNALFQAVTFHHSEIHYPNGEIKSVQTITANNLYVVETISAALSFREARTEEELGWKEVLDSGMREVTEQSEDLAAKTWNIHPDFYDLIPLTELPAYSNQTLPSLSKDETKQIVGQLMEGLYKNYFLGIKKKDGTVTSPLGSTIPIIWIAKNKEYLYVTFETAEGEPILLRQNIPS